MLRLHAFKGKIIHSLHFWCQLEFFFFFGLQMTNILIAYKCWFFLLSMFCKMPSKVSYTWQCICWLGFFSSLRRFSFGKLFSNFGQVPDSWKIHDSDFAVDLSYITNLEAAEKKLNSLKILSQDKVAVTKFFLWNYSSLRSSRRRG